MTCGKVIGAPVPSPEQARSPCQALDYGRGLLQAGGELSPWRGSGGGPEGVGLEAGVRIHGI